MTSARRTVAVVASMLLACAALGIPAAEAGASHPVNDDFVGAKRLGSLPATVAGDSTSATSQPSEPGSACNDSEFSLWYVVRPTAEMVISVDTSGSSINTGASVWRGTALTALTAVACSYGTSSVPVRMGARAAFHAHAGVDYWIQVVAQPDPSSHVTHGGPFKLHVKAVSPPTNDAFSHAQAITALPFESMQTNATATVEPNEPTVTPCDPTRATLWYRIRPTMNMHTIVPSPRGPMTMPAVITG